MFRLSVVIVASAALLTGCVVVVGKHDDKSTSGWQAQQARNQSVIPTLALGTPLEEVQGLLGQPHFTEAFADANAEYRVLFYRTQHVRSDGRTTRDETTPVVFRDGRLDGFGDDYYRRLLGGDRVAF